MVGIEQVGWWFNVTHHFLTGIERGMYMNDSIALHTDCFGPRFVTKINEFGAMVHSDFWKNIVQELSIIYQLYFMLGEKCKIDQTINDLYLFCWNEGCNFDSLWGNTETNVLYMTRALIDAAIVWYEGVPATEQDDVQQWHNLSRQTGETFAEIIKELTDFVPQNGFEMRPFRD